MDDRHKALGMVMFMSFFWATQITMSKIALNAGARPMPFLFQMLAVAAVIISIITLSTRRHALTGLRRHYLVPLLSIALVGSVLANITGYIGLEQSSSINYGFLIKSAVVFTVVLAYLFLDEHISRHKLVLLTGLIAGVYLVTTQGRGIVPSRYDILIILSAFFYALSNTIAKSVLVDIDPQIVAFFRTFGGVVLLGAALALAGEPLFDVVRYDHVAITGIILACMQMTMYRALRITSVSYLSMMSMMTPVIVAVLGIVFLREPFTVVQAAGGGLILVCGVFIYKKKI